VKVIRSSLWACWTPAVLRFSRIVVAKSRVSPLRPSARASEWEAEFCRVAEAHPRVRAYVKNHNLGFEVPYRFGAQARCRKPPS
jgi:hypothetical protein